MTFEHLVLLRCQFLAFSMFGKFGYFCSTHLAENGSRQDWESITWVGTLLGFFLSGKIRRLFHKQQMVHGTKCTALFHQQFTVNCLMFDEKIKKFHCIRILFQSIYWFMYLCNLFPISNANPITRKVLLFRKYEKCTNLQKGDKTLRQLQ